ncbi:MAG: sodium:solute symporter family protein [Phaeodactylibacter sp.]|uniref:sodium:solute symporter family protein n=1 Tax=Phaeodactylibacter sp. TaxID=1940289 RepID=UPI0032EBA1D4
MALQTWRLLRPAFLLLIMLGLGGAYLHFFTDQPLSWPAYLSMMFFYTLIFGVGAYAASLRKGNDSESIMLAGRQLPLFLAIFTMSATWVGGGYINGTAEYTASAGLVWVQAPWGYALSLVVGGLVFARRMRTYRFHTLLDPLEQRFGKRTAALLFLPALSGELFWTAAILTALGTTFGAIAGLDTPTALVVSALITIAYTALGGLWAVALTDVVQLILLFGGLWLVTPYALSHAGGWTVAWADYQATYGAAASLLPSREALGNYYWNWWDYALLLIFGGVPWQVYFQRVLSSKDADTAVRLSLIAAVVCLLAAVPAVVIGIAAHATDWQAIGLSAPPDAASTLPWVVRYLTPTWVGIIGLGAIAAAVMSSADSSILSASSMASWNVFRPLFKPKASPATLGKVVQRMIWVTGITATLIALNIQSVYELWFLCSDFVYCLLFPVLVCALFDPKANAIGAISGLTVAAILRFGGGDATLGIPLMLPYPMVEDGISLFPFRTTAMLSGLVTILVASRLTQRWSPPKKLQENA